MVQPYQAAAVMKAASATVWSHPQGLISPADPGGRTGVTAGLARYAPAGDFVVVTNNAPDFRRLYAAQKLHAGLVILIPNVDRTVQCRLFKGALDQLAVLGEPVNQVLEVDLADDDVTFALYDLPPGLPETEKRGTPTGDGETRRFALTVGNHASYRKSPRHCECCAGKRMPSAAPSIVARLHPLWWFFMCCHAMMCRISALIQSGEMEYGSSMAPIPGIPMSDFLELFQISLEEIRPEIRSGRLKITIQENTGNQQMNLSPLRIFMSGKTICRRQRVCDRVMIRIRAKMT
jgi:hypothetical protein